ncbi:hypothetical protein CKF58_07320 [Psittacicella hinzii]|uniref:Transposase n=1 Tax=Psittacicella hinzii TaxID=2028575 RepID=A0A3A1YCR7_9GAMM|nr:hypothetical protein [Psittacicella hinzii]RIY34960.1 hypothetical protein CKF58_07320 [Psittacicella hinzii]
MVLAQETYKSKTFNDLASNEIEFLTLLPANLQVYTDLIDQANQIGFKHADRLSRPEKKAKILDVNYQGLELKAHVIKDQELLDMQLVSFYEDLKKKEEILRLLHKNKKPVQPDLIELFKVSQSTDLDFTYEQNNEAIDLAISRLGFIVLVTNNKSLDTEQALNVYSKKGIVDTAFDNLYNGLDFGELRVHSSYKFDGKLFVSFIALILKMHMIYSLSSNELTKDIGLKSSIEELKKIRTYSGNSKSKTMSLTKRQKNILAALNITL